MNCHRARIAIVEQELGELTLGFERGLADHLERCAGCRERAERERLLVGELSALSLAPVPHVDVRVRVMQRVSELPAVETQSVPQRQMAWASLVAVLGAAGLVAGIRPQAGLLQDMIAAGIDGARILLSATISIVSALEGLLLLPWRVAVALAHALAPVVEIAGRLEPVAVAGVSLCLISMMVTIAWVVGNDLRRPLRRRG